MTCTASPKPTAGCVTLDYGEPRYVPPLPPFTLDYGIPTRRPALSSFTLDYGIRTPRQAACPQTG